MLIDDVTHGDERMSRLDAVKSVAKEFVAGRAGDRIGLVLFAGRPYTQCPLTLNHDWLVQSLDRARVGMIESGTGLGSAIATALRRLRLSTPGRKFIILLTDGRNNHGRITPQTAADAAAALGVKVYTIGAGTPGLGSYFARRMFGKDIPDVELDEGTLKAIAATTGSRYFRATDMLSLRNGFAEIDRYERRPLSFEFSADRELYAWLLWLALGILLVEISLDEIVLRKLP